MAGLGEELSRYRMRFVRLLALYPVTAVVALCLAAIAPVLASLALVPLGILTWQLWARGGDRLVVHRDGFAFHDRGTVRLCRWTDIDRVDTRIDAGSRVRMRTVTPRDGGLIVFSPFMDGLVELYRAYVTGGETVTLAVPVRNPDGIGALMSTHRTAALWDGAPAYLLAGGALFFALLIGFVVLDRPGRGAWDGWIAVGSDAGAVGFVALVLWVSLTGRRDELRIHEHGFAYRHRGVVRDCRWDEIAHHRRGRYSIHAVMRHDGTWIEMPGTILAVREYVEPRCRVTPRP